MEHSFNKTTGWTHYNKTKNVYLMIKGVFVGFFKGFLIDIKSWSFQEQLYHTMYESIICWLSHLFIF